MLGADAAILILHDLCLRRDEHARVRADDRAPTVSSCMLDSVAETVNEQEERRGAVRTGCPRADFPGGRIPRSATHGASDARSG